MRATGDEALREHALLRSLIDDQLRAVRCVDEAADALVAAGHAVADALRKGGRLIYLGAGASGCIAVQDGAELPGTFGLDIQSLAFVSPGGDPFGALVGSAGEDDEHEAAGAIEALALGEDDLVIAVSASGSTPFTLAGARAAQGRGARVVAIACRAGAPLLEKADVAVLLPTGPEAVDGSTRLGAGTAQKAALGVISTLACAEIGHVHRGMMVNLRPDNAKLRDRAAGIVERLAEVDHAAAVAALEATQFDVKAAAVAAAGGLDAEAAKTLVAECGGDLASALQHCNALQRVSAPQRAGF
ncbi:MAG: N-acetylmuramic acid 6-phosphate etherase [Hyphomicrobiales bacterium]|nr:N-acetylmuramic acid 6-phosphate etherase [Hyphomicrobiales bacterium]